MQIQKLKGTYKALRDFDVNTCRISAQDNLELIAKIRILKNATDIMNFYYSFLKHLLNQMKLRRIKILYSPLIGHTMVYHVGD